MSTHSAAGETDLIWVRPEPASRAGAPLPDRAQITAAAFEIADREGLHSVSVKRVASKLHIPSLRLEAYLTSRDDLLDLMLDAAFGEIEPADEGTDWRARLGAVAHATQATARRHPWLRSLAGTRTPCGPYGLRHSERALAALDGLGLDASTMTQAVNTVLAYVYGYVQLEMLEPARKVDEQADAQRRSATAEYLMQCVQTGDYPTLARVFADASHLTASDAFEAGLQYVLDGIAAGIATAAVTPSEAAASPATDTVQRSEAAGVDESGPESGSEEVAADPAAAEPGAGDSAEVDSAEVDAESGAGRHSRFGRRRSSS